MLTQILTSAINAVINKIVSTYQGLGDAKFFITIALAFILGLGYIYHDTVDLAVRSHTFSTTDFRECRNVSGLEKDLEKILAMDSNIEKYGVYLYEPKDQAFYKRLFLTNSEIAKNSPSLQSVYLKDQPTINEVFKTNPYFLIDKIDMRQHSDLKYLDDLNISSALFYKLSVNDKTVGEIAFRFKTRPTPEELEKLIKQLSPLLYQYII